MPKGTKKICSSGHTFYKSSDCPTCPQCEMGRASTSGWQEPLGAPARRALENAGIKTVEALARHSKAQILALHGMGPGSLPKLEAALRSAGLAFKAPKA
ncbi:MAG TPA: hypothetical protein VGG33_20400 [Polyangia bacterium]